MIATRLYKALANRGIQPSVMAASQKPTPLFYGNMQTVRYFSKESGGESGEENVSGDEEVEAEEEAPEPEPQPAPQPKAQPAPQPQAAAEPLDRSLFQPFSVGNIKKIESTPDHRPPSEEDTIEGRYSGVLFTTASQNGDLYNVYEDLRFMQEIYKNSEQFRLFTENGGVGSTEIAKLNAALKETATFSDTTMRFLTVLAENKRLNQINDIAEKYAKLYQEFNKEEKITIISATNLSDDQKSQVVAALQANPQNEGKQFTIDYEVDETILGGLQMYTESEFMDMSLSSRLDRISSEVSKLGN